MLTALARTALKKLLSIGSSLKLFPYEFDLVAKQMRPGSKWQCRIFNVQKRVVYFITCFSFLRLMQAMSRDYFPLVLKVLNMVWTMAYVQTAICMYQYSSKENEILQFVNCLLQYVYRDQTEEKKERKLDKVYDKAETHAVTRLSQYFLFGMLMLAANPSVHIVLVDESPCAPHFISSLVLPCEGFRKYYIPFIHKVPFMMIEYYLTTVMFVSWSFNWSMIFLAMSWIVTELRRMIHQLRHEIKPTALQYRTVEMIAKLMNEAFLLYMSTFPTLLFAIVSVLLFGVIRIWHTDPGSNLMFPLCGIRCTYEALTPLEVAATINDKNKEVAVKWKRHLDRGQKTLQRSCNGVRCTAGSLYTFENSIVLCCIHNCMQLTFNMLLTFK